MTAIHEYGFDAFSTRHDLGEHPLHAVIKHFGESDDYWISGGAVRSFAENKPLTTDVDFFFRSREALDSFVVEHAKEGVDDRRFHATFKADIDGTQYKIQAIKIDFYKDPQETIDSFDFTICQFAVQHDKLFVGNHSLWDLGRRRLAIHKVTYASATVRRLIKYTRQGFYACEGCIASILEAVAENPRLIRADVQYVD